MDLEVLKQISYIAMLTILIPLYIIITIKNKTETKGLSSVFPDMLLLIGTIWLSFDSLMILYERFK